MSNKDLLNFFSWETEFDASVIIDDVVYPNSYNLSISFIPKNDNIKTQNIGFEKIKYLFERLCENSVIFSPVDKTKDIWFKMPVNKILLPGSPYDQLLGVVLFQKLKSIAGDFFYLGHLTVDSKLGDRVKYTVDNESFENKHLSVSEWIGETEFKPWWYRDDTATVDQRIDAKTIWTGAKTWKDIGFEHDGNRQKKSFEPTVIDGGRDK